MENRFTPSILHALQDYLLSLPLLMMITRFYLEDDDEPDRDFMASPYFTPKELIEHYPKIYLLIAERDPLHDDSIRYLCKLL